MAQWLNLVLSNRFAARRRPRPGGPTSQGPCGRDPQLRRDRADRRVLSLILGPP